MSKKAAVRARLEKAFQSKIVKDSSDGFKINIKQLDDSEIITLGAVSVDMACDVSIKRSGTGVVVLIGI